jgi:uncharacterized protein YlxW (UPF0749 family)
MKFSPVKSIECEDKSVQQLELITLQADKAELSERVSELEKEVQDISDIKEKLGKMLELNEKKLSDAEVSFV